MASQSVTVLPDEFLAHVDKLTKLVDQLARATVAPYELSDALAIGGTTGVYTLLNPYATPCEFSVEYYTAFDVSSAIISTQNNLPQLANNALIGAASATANQPGYGSALAVLATSAQGTIPGSANWYPLANTESLTMALTVANGRSGFLTVQFRRRKTPAGVVAF